jgi:NADP-dependent 3-hydroxy acid dehydrogenase YdfG
MTSSQAESGGSRIRDRVFLITGASGAIAAPIVRIFAAAGARLALVEHRASADSAERARAIGGLAITADLTTPDGAEQMVRTALAELGRVDGLIHTVGGWSGGTIVGSDPTIYDRMFDLNVRSLFYTLRAVVPALTARGDGFIAAISSQPGWTGQNPGAALYGAAKSAATSLLRSLDSELRGTKVAVAIVYPMGTVDTLRNRAEMPNVDLETWIDPEEIAETLLHAAGRGPRGRLRELPIFGGRSA